MSDVDLSALAGRQDDDDDPPILTPQPDSMEELQPSSPVLLHPRVEAETQPGDLAGQSDGGDFDNHSCRKRFGIRLSDKKSKVLCRLLSLSYLSSPSSKVANTT